MAFEEQELNIGVFMDFENLILGAQESGSNFDFDLVLTRLLEKGRVIVKRAYADWQRYAREKHSLHSHAVELIDIPQRRQGGKNSADIRLVVDVMDLCYSKDHIHSYVIGSGDSDFSPLVSKLRENNKGVIGFGVKSSTSNLLVDNCDEFIFYDDLVRESRGEESPSLQNLPKKKREAFQLLVESVHALMRENKEILWGSMVKQTMLRKKPSFNEGYYGYDTFSQMLEDGKKHNIFSLKKDQRSGTYIVTGLG